MRNIDKEGSKRKKRVTEREETEREVRSAKKR
jgi:hypothetical protein